MFNIFPTAFMNTTVKDVQEAANRLSEQGQHEVADQLTLQADRLERQAPEENELSAALHQIVSGVRHLLI